MAKPTNAITASGSTAPLEACLRNTTNCCTTMIATSTAITPKPMAVNSFVILR